jgi:hypothetical protein
MRVAGHCIVSSICLDRQEQLPLYCTTPEGNSTTIGKRSGVVEKKFIVLFLILWVFFMAGCTSPAVSGAYIKKPLTTKSTIVITSDNVLSDALVGELIKRGYAVMTKNDLDRVLSGQAMSLSGLSEQDRLVHGGKILKADAVMTIKMVPFSWDDYKVYTATVKLFGTERGDIIGSVTYQNATLFISRDPLPGSAERIAKKLFEGAD